MKVGVATHVAMRHCSSLLLATYAKRHQPTTSPANEVDLSILPFQQSSNTYSVSLYATKEAMFSLCIDCYHVPALPNIWLRHQIREAR